jgi:hypothetical protein
MLGICGMFTGYWHLTDKNNKINEKKDNIKADSERTRRLNFYSFKSIEQ